MNEQQRGQYNALILQQEVYQALVNRASKALSNAIEDHIKNPSLLSEQLKYMAENSLDGYRDDLYFINSKIEAFLKNL